ncbi:MAG: DeoR/GlpR family DNA-binding transcription regulator [Primorskyibacter sp.]
MSQSARHAEILALARRDGRVTVERLAAQFGVTLQTIRRDLADLAEAGRLERVHGGAILPSGTTNIDYEDRRDLNRAAKAAIAQAMVARIPQTASVFLNIGTTAEAVARALIHHKGLLVVTNNLNVATILSANPECDVIVSGGALRAADGGLVGGQAAETMARFKCDLAVVGCSAVDLEGDLLDFDPAEVAVSQVILRQARRVFVVADGSKWQRNAPVRIASLAAVEALITDTPVPQALAERCADWGTDIVLA